MQVEIIQEVEQLERLRPDWTRLSELTPAPNPFKTIDWVQAWWRHVEPSLPPRSRSPYVLVFRDGAGVQAIAPFMRSTVALPLFGQVRKLELTGAGDLEDYADLSVASDPPGNLPVLFDFLSSRRADWDIVEMRNLRLTDSAAAALSLTLRDAGLAHTFSDNQDPYPYLAIRNGSPGILLAVSKSSRHTIQNQRRRVARLGLKGRMIEDPSAEPNLISRLVQLERRKLANRSSVDPCIGRVPRFFDSLFRSLGPKAFMYVAVLEDSDRLVAYQVGFRSGLGLWDYSKAYDPEYHALSPGTWLTLFVADYGAARGYVEYDFLRGAEPYKLRFANDCHSTKRLLIWNNAPAARLRASVYLGLRRLIRNGPSAPAPYTLR
jgi:CelD/BcsL family acetyltransferase involved in cellulose biosynthesis